MAQLADSTVFIAIERGRAPFDSIVRLADIGPLVLSSVTAAELLIGLYRADTDQRRLRRETFIEEVLHTFPVLSFGLPEARAYASLLDDLRRSGQVIETHDLQIAATALAGGHDVITENVRHFRRVPGVVIRTLADLTAGP